MAVTGRSSFVTKRLPFTIYFIASPQHEVRSDGYSILGNQDLSLDLNRLRIRCKIIQRWIRIIVSRVDYIPTLKVHGRTIGTYMVHDWL